MHLSTSPPQHSNERDADNIMGGNISHITLQHNTNSLFLLVTILGFSQIVSMVQFVQ